MHAIWVTVALLEAVVISATQPTTTETLQPGERIMAGRQGMTFPQNHKWYKGYRKLTNRY